MGADGREVSISDPESQATVRMLGGGRAGGRAGWESLCRAGGNGCGGGRNDISKRCHEVVLIQCGPSHTLRVVQMPRCFGDQPQASWE